jgi:hypothetical protein
MSISEHSVGHLHEHLHACAPSLGCRPEEMWRREEEQLSEQRFRCRVVRKAASSRGGSWGSQWTPCRPTEDPFSTLSR